MLQDPDRFSDLPVSRVLTDLMGTIMDNHAVLTAPTGSGKTTLVPLALLQSPLSRQGKILMLEPRRIAARAAARRMSKMICEPVGKTIGYRTRFESKISGRTRVEVITEGILVRKLQKDPGLEDTSVIIFDEFHERNLQSDLSLALCLDLCELREDLRILVMSATLEADRICSLLHNAPHISAAGRSYPVAIHHSPPATSQGDLADQMANLIGRAWREQTGDILAFFPGVAEIRRCESRLTNQIPEALTLPLYGNLSHEEQDRIFDISHRKRRIILATPIAETSLTIEHVGSVVDSGYYRRPIHDPGSGLSRLSTMRISRASADQRTGRAGRTGPGYCYRLWSSETEHSLLEQTPPEIVNGDLASLVLELALWGVTDPTQLRWLDPPRKSSWDATAALLQKLNLLDHKGNITAVGRNSAALPAHPRLTAILLGGKRLGLTRTACLVAAVLSERDILKGNQRTADIEERLRLLEYAALNSSSPHHGSDMRQCRLLLRQAQQWQKILGGKAERSVSYAHIGTLLAFGFPDRIARLRDGSRSRYLLAGGRGVVLPESDVLNGTKFLVAPQVDGRRGDGKIFLAASISEADIRTHHSHLIDCTENMSWNPKEKRVEATSDTRLGTIILHSEPLASPSPQKITETFLYGIRQEGIGCLPFTRKVLAIQARVCSLHHWYPENWPDWSDTTLLQDLDWLVPYCCDMHSLRQLQELDLATILRSRLNWDQQLQLDELAPTHIQVPSGSRIRLDYTPGKPPVLAVRLQEMFGLCETPHICRNSVPVLLHLLSPARRPLQITSDLKSFWHTAYPEIRKELAGRYPKHHWPTEPMTAAATTKTKKQMKTSGSN